VIALKKILEKNRENVLFTVRGNGRIVRITDSQSVLAQITMDLFQKLRIDKHQHVFALYSAQWSCILVAPQ
jgi:hypothetical protein